MRGGLSSQLYFPPVITKPNKNLHPNEKWMTTGILISRNSKLSLYKKSKINPTAFNIENYKNYRNIFNKTIRTAKNFILNKHSQKPNLTLSKPGLYLTKLSIRNLKRLSKI